MDSRPEQILSEKQVEKCVEGSFRTDKLFYFLFGKPEQKKSLFIEIFF